MCGIHPYKTSGALPGANFAFNNTRVQLLNMIKKDEQICEGKQWIDVTDPSQAEMMDISRQYGLTENIVRDCMQPEHLPKYESVNDVNFLILRFYAHTSGKRMTTIQDLTNKVAIFYTNDVLITIHKHDVPFLNIIRNKHVTQKKCTSITDVITKIAWGALETFDNPADRLSEQIEFYENQIILKRSGADQTQSLYAIKREATIAQKIIMLMLEPINHIYIKQGEETALQDVRDQHLKMQTLYHQLLEDVNNLLHLSLSFSAQRTNEIVKVLTLFSVFFMPLTFIVGVYGMNFSFMPELRQKWGYPAVLVLMAVIALVIYFWFKRKKWL